MISFRLLSLLLVTTALYAQPSIRGGAAAAAGNGAMLLQNNNNQSYNEDMVISMRDATNSADEWHWIKEEEVSSCGCPMISPLDWMPLMQQQQQHEEALILYGSNDHDFLGWGQNNGNGVVTHGNFLAVASRHDTNSHGKDAGSVTVYEHDGISQQPIGQVLEGGTHGDYFGFSVDLLVTPGAGSYVATGAIRYHGNDGSYQGAANVYRLDDLVYPPQWRMVGGELHGDHLLDHFGHSVALAASTSAILTVAVGAIQHAGTFRKKFPGYSKVFRVSNPNTDASTKWEQVGQTLVGDTDGDKFGNCIAMSKSGNIVAVSAPGAFHESGIVKIFRYSSEAKQWVQLGETLQGEEVQDSFGSAMSMSEKMLVIGAPHAGSFRGAVYIYHLDVRTHKWNLIGTIRGTRDHDEFGSSVSINGRRVAVGSPGAGALEEGQVQVYEYSLSTNEWQSLGSSLQAMLPASNLGSSVSLSGNRLVASAPHVDNPTEGQALAGAVYQWDLL